LVRKGWEQTHIMKWPMFPGPGRGGEKKLQYLGLKKKQRSHPWVAISIDKSRAGNLGEETQPRGGTAGRRGNFLTWTKALTYRVKTKFKNETAVLGPSTDAWRNFQERKGFKERKRRGERSEPRRWVCIANNVDAQRIDSRPRIPRKDRTM